MTLTLVYDGGCPFCRSFALRSELVGGIKELEIRDGRADNELRSRLQQQGYRLADGAIITPASATSIRAGAMKYLILINAFL